MKPTPELERHLYPVDRDEAATPSPASRPLNLQPDWQRICTDLTSLGLVRITVANPLARLGCLCEPWSARCDAGVARVDGPGVALRALTGRLAAATVENGSGRWPGERRLRWWDWRRNEQLCVSLTEQSTWSCFRSLLVRQWAQPALPRAVVDGPSHGTRQALQAGEPADTRPHAARAWYGAPADPESPSAIRGRRSVDPTLLPPFLDTLAENASTVRVLVGNAAVLHEHETDFYRCDVDGDWLRLSGGTATLSLRHAELAHADLVEGPAGCDAVRISDRRGRPVATLCTSEAAGADGGLWQTLVHALGHAAA